MLCSGIGCLFVHVPKTGGNAVQGALSAYADDEIVCLQPHHDGVERFEVRNRRFPTVKHSSLEAYWRHYPASLYDGLLKVSVLRNTFDRALSHFFSPHRGDPEWSEEAFLRFCEQEVRPLRHYWCLPGQTLDAATANVGVLLRFERLEADLRELGVRLGVSLRTPARRNIGPARKSQVRWSPPMVDHVGRLFAEEIELFGFSAPEGDAPVPAQQS